MNDLINIQKGSHPVRVGQRPNRASGAECQQYQERPRREGHRSRETVKLGGDPMVSSLGRAAGFGGTALDRTFPVGGTVWGNGCRHKRAYGEQGGQGGWLSPVPGHGVWSGPRAHRTASEAQWGPDPCVSSSGRRRLRQGDRKPNRGTCRSPGGRGGGCGWRGLARCCPEGQAHWHWGTGLPEAGTLHTSSSFAAQHPCLCHPPFAGPGAQVSHGAQTCASGVSSVGSQCPTWRPRSGPCSRLRKSS